MKTIAELCEVHPLSGYAYFFFDSRDSDKGLRLFENMIRSLISQLASRCGGIPFGLKKLYNTHRDGRDEPSLELLQQTLQGMIEGFDHVYIMIDSLDECGERPELLRWIKTMASWDSTQLHLLFTSRPEPDIMAHLNFVSRLRDIRLQGSVLERDIGKYLDEQLALVDGWSDHTRALVKAKLMGGADGM